MKDKTKTTSPFGVLCDYDSGNDIRPATRHELAASLTAGPEGVILVDGRRVYVSGADADDLARDLKHRWGAR